MAAPTLSETRLQLQCPRLTKRMEELLHTYNIVVENTEELKTLRKPGCI